MKSAKFKDSPLGPIPQDWEVKRLGDLCSITTGHKDVNEGSELGLYPFFTCSRNVYRANSYSFDGEAILIAGNGEVGNLHYYDGKFEAYQRTYVLMDFSVNVAFLRQYLSAFLMRELMDDKTGSSMPYIVLSALSNCPIPYPSEDEQQRIAEALGEVDKLIESLDEQIEKKRLIAKGVAHDLLSAKKRLPGFKGEWREVAFKVAFISLGNNTYARECLCGDSANSYDIHYGDVLIRFGAVVDFSYDSIPRLKDGIKPNKDFLQDGDIVFADTAEDEMVGKAVEIRGLGDDKAVSGLHTMACRPRADMFAPRFLGYYLNSDSYRKQLLPLITGSKVSSLSRANFESTTLTMPDRAEQQAIAEALAAADSEIAGLEAKKRKYEQIKSGMMRDLLTGKVRMKGE